MIAISLTKVDTNLLIAIATVAGGLLVALIGHVLGGFSNRAEGRRARYAEMTRTLVAYSEIPYRIRRRTSDAPDTLAQLTSLIHDVQERLEQYQSYLGTEARWLARAHADAVCAIKAATATSIADAWNRPPIKTAAGMMLNGWGPGSLEEQRRIFTRHLRWRFGLRRPLNPGRLLCRAVKHRLDTTRDTGPQQPVPAVTRPIADNLSDARTTERPRTEPPMPGQPRLDAWRLELDRRLTAYRP